MLAFIIFLLLFHPFSVSAASDTSYKDYLYQYDIYRQVQTEYQTAKTSYEKFKSLSSETTATDATRRFLTQRNILVRTYILVLKDKLSQQTSLDAGMRQQFQDTLQSEITLLNDDIQSIASTQTLGDVLNATTSFDTHYSAFQLTVTKTQLLLSLGRVHAVYLKFVSLINSIQSLKPLYEPYLSPQKLHTVNQWITQITDKKTQYDDTYASLMDSIQRIKAYDASDLERQSTEISKQITQLNGYMTSASSYLVELSDMLKYTE